VSQRRRRTWPRAVRLRKRREFLAVQGSGRTFHGQHFLVIVGPPVEPGGRLGITVTKRVGNAVTRNRIRRWVRELVRCAPGDQWVSRGRDIVVIAKASAAHARHAEVDDDLANLGARL
jgi:ribonuclease P protein component